MIYIPELLPMKLRQGREYRALSQEELGRVLSIHATSYQKYEAGIRQCNATQLAVIANLEKLDLSFYFIEEMSPRDGDLELKQFEAPLERISNRLESIESRILPPGERGDPLYLAIIENPALRKLVETVQHWDQRTLERFTDMAFAYFSGQEER